MSTELAIWDAALGRIGDFGIELEAAQGSATATAANPVVVTQSSHGHSSGEHLYLSGFTEQTELNGRIFELNVLTSNTYELVGENGAGRDAETTGGTTQKLYSGRHVTQLARAWPIVRDEVLRQHPWNCASKTTRLAREAPPQTIVSATAADPIVIEITGHGYAANDLLKVSDMEGMTEINGRFLSVAAVLTANTFEIGVDGSDFGTYSASSGSAAKILDPIQPDFGYEGRYPLPSDYLGQPAVYCAGRWVSGPSELWEIVGSFLYSDETPTVPLRYVYAVTDPEVFDALLSSLLIARLAAEIAERLTQSNTKKEALEAKYEDLLRAAKRADGLEQSPMPLEESSWVLARFGGTGLRYRDWNG